MRSLGNVPQCDWKGRKQHQALQTTWMKAERCTGRSRAPRRLVMRAWRSRWAPLLHQRYLWAKLPAPHNQQQTGCTHQHTHPRAGGCASESSLLLLLKDFKGRKLSRQSLDLSSLHTWFCQVACNWAILEWCLLYAVYKVVSSHHQTQCTQEKLLNISQAGFIPSSSCTTCNPSIYVAARKSGSLALNQKWKGLTHFFIPQRKHETILPLENGL